MFILISDVWFFLFENMNIYSILIIFNFSSFFIKNPFLYIQVVSNLPQNYDKCLPRTRLINTALKLATQLVGKNSVRSRCLFKYQQKENRHGDIVKRYSFQRCVAEFNEIPGRRPAKYVFVRFNVNGPYEIF